VKPLADGALVGKKAPGPGAIDDDRLEILGTAVALLEQPALEKRQTEQTEVFGADRYPRRHRLRLACCRRKVFEIELLKSPAPFGAGCRRTRCATHREPLEAPLQLIPERDDATGGVVLRRRQRNRPAEDVVRIEPEIDAPQLLQADEQQTRHDQHGVAMAN
jgi:hypothetical protein